jgi:hypothetical protein
MSYLDSYDCCKIWEPETLNNTAHACFDDELDSVCAANIERH